MVFIGDKYDIPLLLRASGDKLCRLADSMHFIKPGSQKESSKDQDEWNNAARWLAIADRLDMQELKTLCQYVIVRDMGANAGKLGGNTEADAALQSLDAVPSKSIGEICYAIMDLIYEGIIHRDTLGSLSCRKRTDTRSTVRSAHPANLPHMYWAQYEDMNTELSYSQATARCLSCQSKGCLKGAVCATLDRVKKGTQ